MRQLKVFPYFGFGVGPGWQSWSRLVVQREGYVASLGEEAGGNQPLHQKIIANVVVNLDWGLQMMSLNSKTDFSLLGGCKFNYWGQTRNLGKLTQQKSGNVGLEQPFSIKKVYQWAPYLGVQWNFPYQYTGKKAYYLGGKCPGSFKPYRIASSLIQKGKGLITEFNVGVGTLRFSGVKGNLSMVPNTPFQELTSDISIKGRLSHNSTPLFEYAVGYQFFPRLKTALSYQHQGNVTVQTQPLNTFNPLEAVFYSESATLTSDLTLDALMLKVYYEHPRYTVWCSLVNTFYIGVGTGAVWQTWKNISLDITSIAGVSRAQDYFDSIQVDLRRITSPNLGMMVDVGMRTQSPYPNTGFSVIWGAKFNFWGQARNIGAANQQLPPKYHFVRPFSIRTVYQWAPYLGVQWLF